MQPHDPPSRRRLILQLAALAATVPWAGGPVNAAPGSSFPRRRMQALASVCTELTGISNESEALTQQYLTVLLKSLDKAQWNALLSLANASPKNQRMASLQAPLRDVVEFALQLWVSGMAGSTEVVTYVGAPIWSVLTFTKPPGICGGAFGYWSERPI
ncbi:MAG: hypothetical protein JZU58_21070 [Curvibacter lanceolatus]|uniref:sugar dehydrogenase complex small subunit n=1 Tax=Curvibacter lanceolatus TaxID=86182 RepID=UPI002355FFF1|nr:sugar dehydrogenase complex small subunit [Curvibacter lanceolatus]MBV5294841.1 hypothetical protein [Curvibacter lanceolatus]